ncbi:Cold-shock protein DNA-binding [Blastocystis hominis]|uniref:Cold-shock protein DNA-binding n=1 Tax=Blastocystis hominis TaxID=12968 RepID=D8M3K2_BLAHO|nr:Cold-shock protein DNA-binding [Blastocystis hominis]CBK22475.2 Cold-shock protein DNA-binding [Blastocystis hominis]|eukprot:XP_012896523.1 Cold-shock protein DNA-binding [Blastocystis hominis]
MFGLVKSVTSVVPRTAACLRYVYTGKCKWFNNKKGYGFIIPDPGSDLTTDIFVHQSSIKSSGFRFLKEGESVEFDVTDGQKGKVATNVTAPGGLAFNRVLV